MNTDDDPSAVLLLSNNKEKIKIFTTRPDTIFGASFIAIAPDHPFTQFFEND